MKPQIYKCRTHTEQRDRAHLYYIQVNAAHTMQEREGKTEIYNRHGTLIAEFITA